MRPPHSRVGYYLRIIRLSITILALAGGAAQGGSGVIVSPGLPAGGIPLGGVNIPIVLPNADVEFTAPAHGAFYSPGVSKIFVTGKIKNTTPSHAALTVNGAPVAVKADRSFVAYLPIDATKVFNTYVARLLDTSSGQISMDRVVVLSGSSASREETEPESLFVRLNEEALDQIQPVVDALASNIPTSYLQPGYLMEFCDPNSWTDSCVDISLTKPVTIAGFGVTIDPNDGGPLSPQGPDFGYTGVSVDFGALTLQLQVVAQDSAPWDEQPSCVVDVNVPSGTINGKFKMSDPNGDGSIVVAPQYLGATKVDFSGFSLNVWHCKNTGASDLKDAIVGAEQSLEDAIHDNFEFMVQSERLIEDALEDALAQIQLAKSVGSSLGISLPTKFTAIQEDDSGIDFLIESAMMPASDPSSLDPILPEYLSPQTPRPKLGICSTGATLGNSCNEDWQCWDSKGVGTCTFTTPSGNDPYSLSIVVTPKTINQYLRSQTERGAFSAVIDAVELGSPPTVVPLDVQFASILFPKLAQLGLDPATPLEIRVHASLAPVVTGKPGPATEDFELLLSDLRIDLVKPAKTAMPLPTDDGWISIVDDASAKSSASRTSLAERATPNLSVPSIVAIHVLQSEAAAKLIGALDDPFSGENEATYLSFALSARLGLDFHRGGPVYGTSFNTVMTRLSKITDSDVDLTLADNPIGESETQIGFVIPFLKPFIVSTLGSLVGPLPSIELPSIESFDTWLADLALVGDAATNRSVGLYIDLLPAK